ncbi:hypothetical protein [Thalassospira sp. TSL5-1]|uniref:hypothetical protein n=1 Tax=Thalassospira sp. TSL5-1 TaxID=1544451 RepID=UPI00093C7078|nr:hypothetical protein [Thalassospira sp. TSL5-1]OKH89234.1 hypothetical protein LF95_04215 [Thalassospira sp. TSL5-1]
MSKSNLPLKSFIEAMARQLCLRRRQAFYGMSRHKAQADAFGILDMLSENGTPFGHPSMSWNKQAATETANAYLDGEFTGGEPLP